MVTWNSKINNKLRSSLILLSVFSLLIGNLLVHQVGNQAVQWGINIVVVLLAILAASLISRRLSQPLIELTHAAAQLSLGKTDMKLEVRSKDELGQLTHHLKQLMESAKAQARDAERMAKGDLSVEVSLKSEDDLLGKHLTCMVETLRELGRQMENMANEHQAGDIDVTIQKEKFQGDFQKLAVQINDIVYSHISIKKKAMSVIAEFSEGNFDVPLEKFPGKKAFINDNIEKLRSNVNSFIQDMHYMSSEHDRGEIEVTIRADQYKGAFYTMAQGVNTMVNGHISVKKKAMAVVAEFANGNFDAPLEPFPGKKAFINQNLEALRSNLKEVNSEIGLLIYSSNEGRLSERANINKFSGDWAKLISGLNGLIDAILEPIQEASAVLNEMAKGNLRIRVNGNYKGDHAHIKNALNDTLQTLSEYVEEISQIMTDMADGNLDVTMTKDYRGDFTDIKTSINHIIHSFNELLLEIGNASGQVAAGSKQVSDSAQALSHGATEQASSIQQLTASVEQISSQTQINARSANEANNLAEQAKTNAIQGNDQMKQMLKAMDGINEAAGNISKIIKVIDEMAFQTNILALNAAVEAARAGQHGKGFAVVAEEVRNLAARSANAAKETTVLIEGSIVKVEGGTKIANHTAEALNKIVEDVAKATELVGQIARASNEQAVGISQINQGIGVVSDVTQTNSATSEESAAASEELSSQAEALKQMVSRFRLKRQDYLSGAAHQEGDSEFQKYLFDLNRKKAEPRFLKPERMVVGNDLRISLGDKEFGKY